MNVTLERRRKGDITLISSFRHSYSPFTSSSSSLFSPFSPLTMTTFCRHKSKQFNEAARAGNLPLLKELSLDCEVDLNLHGCGDFLYTAFHLACHSDHVGIVSFLLDFKERPIELNPKETSGSTPFSLACYRGNDHVVDLLLQDERIDVNMTNSEGKSPLWWASRYGYLGVVKRILASGRTIKLGEHDSDPVKVALSYGYPGISSLLKDFVKDPEGVRAKLRLELDGEFDDFLRSRLFFQLMDSFFLFLLVELRAGELFALAVYLSDGHLEIQQSQDDINEEKRAKAKRFFSLTTQLPMDLQMVLCNRVFGFQDLFIKISTSEKGFRKFAKGL